MLAVKEKNLDRREWYDSTVIDFSCRYHKDDFFEGGIGLITFKGLSEPEIVTTSEGELIIAQNGYQWLELAPKKSNYVITSMFRGDDLFQQYIDITLKNEIFENGDAKFYDLFLDVVLLGDGTLAIIDTEELEEALAQGVITKEQYNLANQTANDVLEYCKINKVLIKEKLYEYKKLFM